jgi:hypothetical protein
MIRALTIPLALAAFAVSAAPALAGTSNFSSEPTAGGGRASSAPVATSVDSDADGVSDPFEMSSVAKRKRLHVANHTSGTISVKKYYDMASPQ